jgi:hypothetical protein
MNRHHKIFFLTLALLLITTSVFAQEEDVPARLDYSLWMGAHYSEYQDNWWRVGRYEYGEDGLFPEFKFNLSASKGDGSVTMRSHYYDPKNMFVGLGLQKSDRVQFDVDYISLIRNDGQDQLANLEAREWLGSSPGGKMVTHELTDEGIDYAKDRHQIRTRLKILLVKKGNVTLNVAHRTILEKGNDQKLAMSHCYSCHVESQELQLDQETHNLRAGLEATVKDIGLEYVFAYRKFESSIHDAEAMWDPAIHPVNGGSGAEFTTRVIYDGEVLNFGLSPDTEKFSHTGKVRGKVWKGRLSGSLGYIETENKRTTLKSEAYNGTLAYALPITRRNRLTAKVAGLHRMADDAYVDLPTWREGRPDNNPVDFDFIRYSSLSRIEGKGSLEWMSRVAKRTTLSLLGDYKNIDRVNYPTPETTYNTKQFGIQGEVRYRDTKKWRGSVKYRYENTDNPLHSSRGLLEASGRDILQPTSPNWAFYYQREDLRFLDVTSLPTDEHLVHLKGGWRANKEITLNAGLKTVYDKNSDLDTLDVQHFKIQPDINLVLVPREGLFFNAGYTYDYSQSRGPIAIPLFDG